MPTAIFLRHGESEWNSENLFTGWMNPDINEIGRAQAVRDGKLLARSHLTPTVAFTSYQKRAIHTLWILLDQMNLAWIPEHKSWRLNERHYGALQGLNKSETALEFGEDQVKSWRRSSTERPPALLPSDRRHPIHDPLYKKVDPALLPATESLNDAKERVLHYWQDRILPAIASGETVLIVAHGNTFRSLVAHLENLNEEAIMELNIPIGEPLVYEWDSNMRLTNHYYLDSPEEIAKGVARQIEMGKAHLGEIG